MRILVIDEEFPYPLNTGKRIRSFSLTKVLTTYHEVNYLAYGKPESEAVQHLESNGITCHAVPPSNLKQSGMGFYLRLFANLFSPLPYIVASHYTRRFAARLRYLIREHNYDLIICEWTPYAIYLKDLKGSASIIVAHNIESYIWRRYEANETNSLKKAYIRIQRAKVEQFERSCFSWADGATAVTDIEAEEITKFDPDYLVHTVENGVDTRYFHPMDSDVNPSMLVFTGSMDWRPNQDAVEYFVKNIFPVVRSRHPDLKFTIVGRKPPSYIRDLAGIDGVTVTGTVDDVRPYIAQAALYVVPLRIGGGSRLKILEAMAMQKPVISTTVGAEGLRVVHDENIIISDGDSQFADTIIECLSNDVLRVRIAAKGRQLVLAHYRWDVLGKKLNKYITELVNNR